jgi:cardiolipin synthase
MQPGSYIRYVPNTLTILRLLATPFIFWMMYQRQYVAVLILFAIVATTDTIDGRIARKYNVISKFGAIADPIADKLLLSGSFLIMAITGDFPQWLAILVLGRDLLILLAAAALYLIRRQTTFPPSRWGKLSTFAQILFVGFSLGTFAGVPVAPITLGIQWCVVALVAVSTIDYARVVIRS